MARWSSPRSAIAPARTRAGRWTVVGLMLLWTLALAGSSHAADLYVSPSGADAAACSSASPCRSFDRAYRAAAPGQTVQMAGGSYGAQSIQPDSTKTSTSDVVFAPAPGAMVKVSDLDIFGDHVEVAGLQSSGGWYVRAGADDVTLRDIAAATWYAIRNASNVRVIGGSVGPGQDTTPQITGSTNVVMDGALFHDWRIKNDTSAHVDCLGLFGGNNHVTIRNSRFSNCHHYDTLVDKSVIATANNDVVFENNIYEAPGGNGYYAVGFADCTNCTLRNSTMLGALSVDNIGVISSLKVTANILNAINTLNCGRASFAYNLYGGGLGCGGTGERVGAPGYVDAAHGDYHLTSSSRAIDIGVAGAPATDRDGAPRPQGASADAGAYEYASGGPTPPPAQPAPPAPPSPAPAPVIPAPAPNRPAVPAPAGDATPVLRGPEPPPPAPAEDETRSIAEQPGRLVMTATPAPAVAAPAGVTASRRGGSVRITWKRATAANGTVRYEVLRNGRVVGRTTDTALTVRGSGCGRTGALRVRAVGPAGTVSTAVAVRLRCPPAA